MGRFDEDLAEIDLALELNHLEAIQYGQFVEIYILSGRYDEAIEYCQKGLNINPNLGTLYRKIGTVYMEKGNYKEAIKSYKRALELTPNNVFIEGWIGYTYGLSGEEDKAEQVLNELFKRRKDEYIPATSIAKIYFGLGENDKGFVWLEKAYEERVPWLSAIMVYYKFSPLWKHLNQESRFKALLKKMGLPED